MTVSVFLGLLARRAAPRRTPLRSSEPVPVGMDGVPGARCLVWQTRGHQLGLAILVGLAAVFHVATVRQILARGFITQELAAAQFAQTLPRGSLQVFGNSPPRLYMLMNELTPAYAYLFVYDTNRDLVVWDSYRAMIDESPPDYIAVENDFSAVEYGHLKSTNLTMRPPCERGSSSGAGIVNSMWARC